MVQLQGCNVFVSGANGFIALHVVNQLLKLGYRVIGSIRSQEKADRLLKLFSHPDLSFAIVPDISAVNAFDEVEAFGQHGKQIEVVLHMASPFHYDTDTENSERDLVIPPVKWYKLNPGGN